MFASPLRRRREGQFFLLRHRPRAAVQRFLLVRLRDAVAPARFFTPSDDFGREPEDFFAPLMVARDSFFAAVLDRVFVFVPRVFVLDADRFFAVDAPFRERAVAAGLRVGACVRRGPRPACGVGRIRWDALDCCGSPWLPS